MIKKYIYNYNSLPFSGVTLLFVLTWLLISSCNPTKYVPEEKTLLKKNHIIVDKKEDVKIKKSDILPYVRQKPNRRIFGTRFYLGLYNMSNIEKDWWFHRWLRKIGEEPEVFDPQAMLTTKNQIKSFIDSEGYFDSPVKNRAVTDKRQTNVYYNIDLIKPYTIRNIYYEIADSNIRALCYFDSINCLIERGEPFNRNILQKERSRFERFVKDHGFYGFSGENISFHVDSTVGNRKVDIRYIVRNFMKVDSSNNIIFVPHSIYRINKVYIYPDFVPKYALEKGDEYLNSFDTIEYKGYFFITDKNKPEIRYDLILQSLYLKAGSVFNVTNTEQTQSHLLSLSVCRLVSIYYNEAPTENSKSGFEKKLNCNIQITIDSQQSYKVELEGTNSAGNLGGALNLIYQHKNLFRGAELFSMKLKGAYEALPQQSGKLKSTKEFGAETSLRIPRLMLPFIEKEGFIRKYNPATQFLAAYNYQNLPYYTRTMVNATFGYTWKAGNYQQHILNPLQLNVVRLPSIDDVFRERIESSSYLAYSYKDVMMLGGNYSYIFTNQSISKIRDYWFMRINFEAAGNMLALGSRISGAEKKDGTYNVFGQPYAQYIRTDLDLRYNVLINDVSSIVYRGFAGVGIPYGNSKAVPFEKQYFEGGANGVRAWQVRSLGPGSYNAGDTTFLNQTADIKLEANIEYRFKLFWILEGALFLDAGNIWTYYEDPSQPGSRFSLDKFYKDIAIGTGAGLRFDFKFVIGRLDMGMKLRDPVITDGSKWIMFNRPYNFKNDFAIVLAIGYPF